MNRYYDVSHSPLQGAPKGRRGNLRAQRLLRHRLERRLAVTFRTTLRALCALAMTTVILMVTTPSFAQESSADLRDIDRKLSVLETKVNRLTNTHAQIISKQSQIKDELDSLRIWIRRNRGGK